MEKVNSWWQESIDQYASDHEETVEAVQVDRSNFDNILFPMIRRVLPSLIASDIIGVQPMSNPTSQIFSMRYGIKN